VLVLSRIEEEVIEIGPDIEVKVVEVRADGRVRLGITAPREISVHRKEVAEAIRRENREAAKVK
jgi:carbon storage regulator